MGTGRYVLAGITTSISEARVYLHGIEEMSGSTAVYNHVDDLAQVTQAMSSLAVVDRAVADALTLTRLAHERGLQISTKSVVASDRRGVADRVARRLRAQVIELQPAKAAEDLGVTIAFGARRAIGAHKKCRSRNSRRPFRAHQLMKKAAAAARLWATGADTQGPYGQEAQGASTAKVVVARTQALRCLPSPGKCSCATTMLEWFLGEGKDLGIAFPCRQVKN